MDPMFIYFGELEFDKDHRFTLKFTNNEENEETNNVLLSSSKKDYYITRMKCYLKIEGKTEDPSNYGKIKESSDIFNDIIENGADHLYEFNKVEYIIDTRGYENKKRTFDVIMSKRKNNTRNFKFHDLKTNKEKTIEAYRTFAKSKSAGSNFKNVSVGEHVITSSNNRKKLQKKFIGILKRILILLTTTEI